MDGVEVGIHGFAQLLSLHSTWLKKKKLRIKRKHNKNLNLNMIDITKIFDKNQQWRNMRQFAKISNIKEKK